MFLGCPPSPGCHCDHLDDMKNVEDDSNLNIHGCHYYWEGGQPGKLVQFVRYKFVDPTSRPSIFTCSNTSPGQTSTQNISSGSIGRTVVFINLSQWNGVLPKWSFLVGKPMVVGYHMIPPFKETSKSPIWRPWYGTFLQNPPWYSTTVGETSTTVIRFIQHGNFLTEKTNIKPMTYPWGRFVYIYLHWSPYKYLEINHSCRWIPSRELTYPPKMAFWRWCSYSQGGIC